MANSVDPLVSKLRDPSYKEILEKQVYNHIFWLILKCQKLTLSPHRSSYTILSKYINFIYKYVVFFFRRKSWRRSRLLVSLFFLFKRAVTVHVSILFSPAIWYKWLSTGQVWIFMYFCAIPPCLMFSPQIIMTRLRLKAQNGDFMTDWISVTVAYWSRFLTEKTRYFRVAAHSQTLIAVRILLSLMSATCTCFYWQLSGCVNLQVENESKTFFLDCTTLPFNQPRSCSFKWGNWSCSDKQRQFYNSSTCTKNPFEQNSTHTVT